MSNPTTHIFETGCYLDSHRGHYITRDAIDFAEEIGFKLSADDAEIVRAYEEHGHEESYPFECLVEICDEAIEWLNANTQKPENAYWEFNDGDFGLYEQEEEC